MEEVRIRITMQKPYGRCGDVWTPDVIVFDTDEGMQTLYDRMKTTAMRAPMTEDDRETRFRRNGTSHERANAFIDNLAVSLGATTLPDPTKAITLPYRELFHALVALFDTPRPAMTEDEMLRRAREAAIVAYGDVDEKDLRAGGYDDFAPVRGALAALRNLDKPLPEPINPLVLKAREIAAKHMHPAYRDQLERGALDDKPAILAVLEALRGD